MNIKITTRSIDQIRPCTDSKGIAVQVNAFMLIQDMKETIKEFLKVVPVQTWDTWCKEFNQEEE